MATAVCRVHVVGQLLERPDAARSMRQMRQAKSGADDMKLLHDIIENRFSFLVVRIWFFGGRKPDTISENVVPATS